MKNLLPAPLRTSLAACGAWMGLILASGCVGVRPAAPLPAPDPETGRLAQQARQLFDRQRPAQAIPLYEAALDRARALDDASAVARLAYNLGACRLETGDASGAAAALEEALQAARVAELPEGETRLLLGFAAMKQGGTDRTLALCRKAIEAPRGQTEPNLRLRFQLLRAQAYLEGGQIDRAEESLKEALPQVTAKAPPAVRAQAAFLEGALQALKKTPSAAAEAFEREAACWSEARRPTDVAAALGRAAHERKQAGEVPAEADLRYRAARAYLGLGRLAEAGAQFQLLDAIPEKDRPEDLAPMIPLLRREIERRGPVPPEREAAHP